MLGIVVFGCLTNPKYKKQLEDILDTWGSQALEAGCILRFYVGDIPDDCSEELKAISVNVKNGDDYMSAQFKQWCGLDDIVSHPCDFYYVCGSDTFLNVKNALAALEDIDKDQKLYIGDSEGCEIISGESYKYFSGGAGFFLTRSAVKEIVEEIPSFVPWWVDASCKSPFSIVTACDLQMGILCKHLEINTVHIKGMYGVKTHKEVELDTIISCHPMSHDDFYEYFSYLCSHP